MRRERRDSCHSEMAAPATPGPRHSWRVAVSLLLVITIGSYGCGTMQIPDYPKTSAGSLRNATTQQDLCIGVRAVTDKRELEQYFGTDLASVRVLPVYVAAENRSLSTSFLISKDNIALQHKETMDSIRQGSETVTGEPSSGYRAAGVAGVVGVISTIPALMVIGAPFLLAGAKASSDATVIKQNLTSKALETRTVSPGKSVDGFVYFSLPDEKTPLAGWALSLNVKELGSDSVHRFIFSLE